MDITRSLYLNGILFNVSTSTEFQAIHENNYNNHTVLSQITFNGNVAHDHQRFVIACAEKLMRRIQQHNGDPFIHVMHDMVTLSDRKNYLGASVSSMLNFDWYILSVALIPNKMSHSSN